MMPIPETAADWEACLALISSRTGVLAVVSLSALQQQRHQCFSGAGCVSQLVIGGSSSVSDSAKYFSGIYQGKDLLLFTGTFLERDESEVVLNNL